MINHKAGMIKQGKGAGKPVPPPRKPSKKENSKATKPKSKKNPKG